MELGILADSSKLLAAKSSTDLSASGFQQPWTLQPIGTVMVAHFLSRTAAGDRTRVPSAMV